MNNETQPTPEQILKLLQYDAKSGIFRWKLPTNQRIKVGSVAGNKCEAGYVQIMINRKRYTAHRLAWLYMTGEFSSKQIDHINGIKDDNRWINLREATHQQNQQNKTVYRNNFLGVKGVRRCGLGFEARIKINKKPISLGVYRTIEEAQDAYIARAKSTHGEFYKETVE